MQKRFAENEVARRQLALWCSAGSIFASGVVVTALTLAGMPERAAIGGLAAACGVFGLVVLRFDGSAQRVGQALGASMTLCYALAALGNGDPSLLGWIALAPTAVLLVSDIKAALGWFIGCGGLIIGVFAFLVSDPSRLHLPPSGVIVVRLSVFLVSVFALTLGSAYVRERTQRSLEEAHDEAKRANALKSQFLASFSHEVRTPLNGVLGTADAMLAGELAPDVREQLLIIQRSGSSLLRTIDDVLELSRVEAGRLDLFPVVTDLPRLLGEVVELFRARASSKGVAVGLALSPGHPRHVMVDDLRLRQVVQNLVSNAVKFTARGQVLVRLDGRALEGGRAVTTVSVEDTGAGISPEAVSNLFLAFTQARPRIDRAEGTGLGLAISHQFVERMGGTLTVDTAPGRGSIFKVELALALAAEGAPNPETQRVLPPARRLKLLVVDDNEINLTVASSLLARLGHEVGVARDGEQALSAITTHQPEVVFMDCHMPVLDGLDATRRLRSLGDKRPVIAVTASVYSEDRERCREAGMNAFVSKPVTLAALQAALAEVAGLTAPAALEKPEVERVLVVDDDPEVRRMTVRLLRAEGYEVADAGDIAAATILFERSEPNHLVVDQVLGGTEDGLQFAARLCGRTLGLHVVLTSGRSPSAEQLRSLEASGGRFLPKPYDRRALIASLINS